MPLQHLRKLLLPVFLFLSLVTQAQSFTQVDHWLDTHVEELGGRALLLIYKDGRIVYNHSVNQMNLRNKMTYRYIARKMGSDGAIDDYTPVTRQPVASCSKWLSAALVMTFVDEGRLRLSDTVGSFLPVMTQHGRGNITIGECLSHLTGIKAPPLMESLQERRHFHTMDDAMTAAASFPMEGKPGTVFHYSNEGLQIAAAVIEKISGRSFEDLFAERIAQPLHMEHTDFGHAAVPLPAGGAISTPQDYLNFLTMILNKGTFNGRRILSENSIREMEVNRITPNVTIGYSPDGGEGYGYGFGEWIMEKTTSGQPSQQVSSPGLFGSFPWVDNQRGYCAFLMTFNLKNKGRIEKYMQLKALVDEALH